MAEERSLRPLSSYLEFGVRLHREDFVQLTGAALLVYLPFAALALLIHPPVDVIFKSADQAVLLLPRMFAFQMIIRILQTLVLVLVILRIEARRSGDENVWDLTEALSRLRRVAAVDLAYFIGIQVVGVIALWAGLLLSGLILGRSPLGLPVAIALAAFLAIGPAVRYYFASLVSLLHGSSFTESFRLAGSVSSGGERLIVTIALTYVMVWFVVWQIFQGIFGGGMAGQIMVQAGVMVTSISYFLAGYLLYMDLAPSAEDRVTLSREGTEGPALDENPAPDENSARDE